MFDFRAINQQVAEAESGFSMDACKELLESCDNSEVVTPKPLQCGGGITAASQCPDFDTVADVLGSTLVKNYTMACPTPGESCSLTECAASCRDNRTKEIATGILTVAAQSRNASIAVSYAKPLLECNFVIDELLGALSMCNDLKTGTLMLGVGFFVGGLMFGLAIYIMFRGSCIWGDHTTKSG
ncbi:hypothetical protein DQ04_22371000 [Trypanosoma grayi]|uniref:hypothetical protein n=1 Tax=Trypanosoma grayi TaxID=71804 RepID=UPI0004F44A49|nr:hypothetical protein DQ04_22371000 [Trypanosoma grayi]KEG05401.1 hypothetical protein DQ04_22371000 [Trypanosoma grayi]